jgi:hypothetical protein
MMELYLRFPIRLHGVVVNLLSTGTTLCTLLTMAIFSVMIETAVPTEAKVLLTATWQS